MKTTLSLILCFAFASGAPQGPEVLNSGMDIESEVNILKSQMVGILARLKGSFYINSDFNLGSTDVKR